MLIRNLLPKDFDKLRSIHERFYKKEFVFPFDRAGMFSNGFVVTDDFDNPITFGMLELQAEALVLTDKSYPINEKAEALYKLLPALEFDAKGNGLDSFYCTILSNDNWKQRLLRSGFKESKGHFLFRKIGD